MNVLIHAREHLVGIEHCVKLIIISHIVPVLLVFKATQLFNAELLNAHQTMIVQLLKNVTCHHSNAMTFVKGNHVEQLMPFVRAETTESHAHVLLL